MKKITLLRFFALLSSKIESCLLPKNKITTLGLQTANLIYLSPQLQNVAHLKRHQDKGVSKSRFDGIIVSYFTLLFFFVVSFFGVASASAQTLPPVLPPASSCTSGDLVLTGAVLEGSKLCSECTPGSINTISRNLILSINNKTGSLRTSFAFWGNLKITSPDGAISNTYISGCALNIEPNKINDKTFDKISYLCGSKIEITNLFMAWSTSNKKDDCAWLMANSATVNPKCGTLPNINVFTGLDAIYTTSQPKCFGNKGTIVSTIGGGVYPYTLRWKKDGEDYSAGDASFPLSTGPYTQTLSDLGAGSYELTITDGNNCKKTKTAVVIDPAPAPIALAEGSKTDVTCAGGDGTASAGTVSGNVGTLVYTWSAINGGVIPSGQINNINLTGLVSGTYSLTVKDDCGTTSSGSVIVAAPAAITTPASLVTQPTCSTATAVVTITDLSYNGSYVYTLSQSDDVKYTASSKVFNSVIPGTYTLKASEGVCSKTGSDVVVNVQPATPVAPTAGVTQPTCSVSTGTIEVSTPSGAGVTYSINGTDYQSGTTFSNVASGNYNITAKANDCVSTAINKTVNTQPATPAAPAAGVTQPTCSVSTGTIEVTAPLDAGVTYSINGTDYQSETTFSYVASGNYNITAKANGCVSTATSKTVNAQPATPAAPTAGVTQPTCSFSMGTIEVIEPLGAGVTYSINGTDYQSGTTFSNVASGNYNITAKANDCVSTAISKTVNTQPATPAAPTAGVTQPTCSVSTGTIEITAPFDAGVTYSINGTDYQSGTTFSNVASGNYNVTAKANGCVSTATSKTVNAQPATPATPTAGVTQPTCSFSMGTIEVTAPLGAGVTFSINGTDYQSGTTFSNVASGNYNVTAKANGCISTAISKTVNAQPASPAAPTVMVFNNCDGSSDLTASNYTGSLLWSNNATTASIHVTDAATYTVTQTTANGCTSLAGSGTSAPNLIPSTPLLIITEPSLCGPSTGSIEVRNPNVGYTYKLNGAEPGIKPLAGSDVVIFSGLVAGSNPSITATNSAGCTSLAAGCTATPQQSSKVITPEAKTTSKIIPLETIPVETASKTAAPGFDAYPVPFKDQLTIKYKFDYLSDVKIEVFNAQGMSVLSKTDTNSYLDKEITLDLKLNKGKEQVYVVKVTTDQGTFTKKVMSSK